MRAFATEFAVKPKTQAEFVSELIGWLRGTTYSTVLDSVDRDVEPHDFTAIASTGESLRVRDLESEQGLFVVGFRHDYPDAEGRNWRTEAVLTRPTAADEYSIRVRTQCQAKNAGARIDFPKKPYLIKAILSGGWGADDGPLTACDAPYWLEPTEADLRLTQDVMCGQGTRDLPVVYVSAKGAGRWDLAVEGIERLAYRLGGVAHVLVEPDRGYSFDLMNRVRRRNAYGGSLGLYVPGVGLAGRFFKSWEVATDEALLDRVQNAAMAARTAMPVRGWDWSELQERSLKSRRTSGSQALEFKELEDIYLEEIETLKQQLGDERQAHIDYLSHVEANRPNAQEDPYQNLRTAVKTELYPGETLDRIRIAANIALQNVERHGIDDRTVAILKAVVSLGFSERGDAFIEQLKDCTSANEKLIASLIPFLEKHGFTQRSENKHIRVSAREELTGVGSITIAKTPSDHRTSKNTRSQIIGILGLNAIDF